MKTKPTGMFKDYSLLYWLINPNMLKNTLG